MKTTNIRLLVSDEFGQSIKNGDVITCEVIAKRKLDGQDAIIIDASGLIFSRDGSSIDASEENDPEEVRTDSQNEAPFEPPIEKIDEKDNVVEKNIAKEEIKDSSDNNKFTATEDLTGMAPGRGVSSFTVNESSSERSDGSGDEAVDESNNDEDNGESKEDNPESKENNADEQLKEDQKESPGEITIKPSFGARGPQLDGIEEPEKEELELKEDDSDEEKQVFDTEGPQIISDPKTFYKFISTIDDKELAIPESNGPLSREEAMALENQGRLTTSANIYVVNMSKGQLVLPDIDIRMRFGDSVNLRRVPAVKLKNSTDLFEAINNKMIRFATPEEAQKIMSRTERRLNDAEWRGGIDVYDGVDDVYDDIDRGPRRRRSSRHDDDPMPRFYDRDEIPHRGSKQGQSRNDYRRGIKTAGRNDRYDDDYDDDWDDRVASVPVPERFRHSDDMERFDVMEGDRYEMDIIGHDVNRRQAQLSGRGNSQRHDDVDSDYDDYDDLVDDTDRSRQQTNRPRNRPQNGGGGKHTTVTPLW